MAEQGRRGRLPIALGVGVLVGAVETLVCISLAALVFSGRVVGSLPEGIGVYLIAGAVALGLFAWLAGGRGIVGGLQPAAAAAVSVLAASTALAAFGSTDRAFLSVVVVTTIVTVASAIACVLLGAFRLSSLVRFVPYPVVGGFLAGTGWLLVKGGLGAAASVLPTIDELTASAALQRWVPAVVLGALLVVVTRVVRHPLALPVTLAIAFAGFAVWTLVTGLGVVEARSEGWVLADPGGTLLELWTWSAFTGADWSAVLVQIPGIAAAILISVIALVHGVGGSEQVLRGDLEANRELRDAGVADVGVAAVGGIPGSHALGSTALAERMRVSARVVGVLAAVVPLAMGAFGAAVIGSIPRFLVGGMLVYLGLSLIVEWVVDARRSLPRSEYVVVLVILVAIAWRGLLPGIVVGAVAALVLFALNYGRIELLREVEFGETFRSNVDRPPAERAALAAMRDRVHILRLDGFVFFGSANALLERIRRRVATSPPTYQVVDLRRVTGMDASAVVSFRKIVHLAEAGGIELILAGVADPVRRQLERGGIAETEGAIAFVPDLDRALERCEDGLLAEAVAGDTSPDGALADVPARLEPYLERSSLPEGTVLIRQDEPSNDIYVLASGRLRVETVTPEGRRMRLRTLRPGVVVGEVAMYTGRQRTADVVADTPVEVLRLSASSIERLESQEPELAAELHRWLARTLAGRLTETLRAFDALLD